MLKNTGENKKTLFFYLILVDIIAAIQVAAVSSFLGNDSAWANKSFFLAFLLSLAVFLFSCEVFEDMKSGIKIARLGFLFLAAGSLLGFFSVDRDMFIFSRIISGLGFGILVAGQIGLVWRLDSRSAKNFSASLAAAFLAGIIFGGKIIEVLSGPALSELKVSFIFGAIVPALAVFESSAAFQSFFEKIKRGLISIGLFLKNKKERIGILGVGHTVNFITTYPFDFILYPYIIWKFGIIKGGIAMASLSLSICYLMLLFYDWAKKDWLGIEAIKGVREYKGKSLWGRFSSWILQKSDPVVLLFLSINFDPFITTAYMRHGAEAYNGMSRRDWIIFFSSAVIANVYWTLVAFSGVSIVEYFWKMFS